MLKYMEHQTLFSAQFHQITNMLINTLEKLITFQTVTGNGPEISRCINWIRSELKNVKAYFEEYEFNGHKSLIITSKKTKKPKLLLQAHLDVVPATKELFVPKIIKERMVGRGVFDMKYAGACYIELLKELAPNLDKLNLGIMFTFDEEVGGFNGVSSLLGEGYSCNLCFLPDGGNNWAFQEGAKGVLQLSVESSGVSGHGSRPWMGKNALDTLVIFLTDLKKEFPKEPCGDKDHYHNTLNIGKMLGGEAANKIADKAQAIIDIRFIPKDTKDDLLRIVKSVAKKHEGINIKELVSGASYKADKKDPYFSLFSEIAKRKYGIKTSFDFSHGSSDARFFAERKIPVILIRPKGGDIHSEKEWIDIQDLERFYLVLKEFVLKVA